MVFSRSAIRTGLAYHSFALLSVLGNFSDRGSSGERPPAGLAMLCAYPWDLKMSQACVSSVNHSPV
jgi:hypothetical protein